MKALNDSWYIMFDDYDRAKKLCSRDDRFTSIDFYSKETLCDRRYKLYLFVVIINDKLYAKFGKAIGESIYERYDETGCTHNDTMIMIWESDKDDKPIHDKMRQHAINGRGYKWAGRKQDSPLHTEEAYYIPNINALNAFIEDLNDEIGKNPLSSKKHNKTYDSIMNLIEGIQF